MAYVNLPGTFPELLDGNLAIAPATGAPRVLILGTAASGVTEALWQVRRPNDAISEFGRTGNLIKGMYEALAQGAEAVYLMRIGGTRASLSGVGCAAGGGGYTVTPNLKDDAAGTRYAVYYEDAGTSPTGGIIMVYDNTREEWVYSNDPDNLIDFGVVSVSGSRCVDPGGDDIGSTSAPIPMASITTTGTTYTAGTDGIDASLMETYEALYNAYEVLDFERFDIVCPQDVTIDALSHTDMSAGTALTAVEALDEAYPTANAIDDALCKLFVQKYQGLNYFWWDVDDDGISDITPSVGASSTTTDANGDTIAAFYEVNFGHQLAKFCYNATENYQASIGMIGVEPPNSLGFTDIATWVGSLPTVTADPVTGIGTIASSADDGSGLLGIKLLAGNSTWRSGVEHGGIIATSSGWMVGTESVDQNGAIVDMGKYLSVVSAWVVHTNAYDTTGRGYLGNFATGYGGFTSTLAAQSAPTNKTVRNVRVPYRIPASVLDNIAGTRLIALIRKPKGVVVTDAPTAARPNTDYTRLTTMRIVAETVQRIRIAGDPFLGEGISTSQIAAMNTSIEQVLSSLKSEGKLQDYRYQLSITPQQAVVGTATVDLILVPAFELRRINVTTTLAAEIA